MKKICVIGSLNADYLVRVKSLPKQGETIFASNMELLPGGKGMNQAVCCARLGMDVTMIGCVGKDSNGLILKKTLQSHNIETSSIYEVEDYSTGSAFVVSSEEDNSIVVVKGSNDAITKEMIDEQIRVIKDSDLVIMQLEISPMIIEYVLDVCEEYGKEVLLNPAPVEFFDKSYVDRVRFLTPNEHELANIFNAPFEEVLKAYPNKVIMTAGEHGAYYHDGKVLQNLKAVCTKVVDTTGAGDAFNGAFASAYIEGASISRAIEIANMVAAKTTQAIGAQSAMSKLSFELQEEIK